MTRRVLALLALVAAAALPHASAAQCSVTGKTNFTAFSVTPASATYTATSTDYNNAATASTSYTVTVSTTKTGTWFLCVLATSANMGTVGTYTKPLSDLQWSTNGTTWTSMTAVATQVKTGTTSLTFTVFVRSKLNWALDQSASATTNGTYGPTNFTFRLQY